MDKLYKVLVLHKLLASLGSQEAIEKHVHLVSLWYGLVSFCYLVAIFTLTTNLADGGLGAGLRVII